MERKKILTLMLKGFRAGLTLEQAKSRLSKLKVSKDELEEAIDWVLEVQEQYRTNPKLGDDSSIPSIQFTQEIYPYLNPKRIGDPLIDYKDPVSISLVKTKSGFHKKAKELQKEQRKMEFLSRISKNDEVPDHDVIKTRRLLAFLIDLVLVMSLFMLVNEWLKYSGISRLSFLFFAIIYSWYFVHFDSSVEKGTPGKQFLGLRVVTLRNKLISRQMASIRVFLKILPATVGYVYAITTGWNWALYDGILLFVAFTLFFAFLASYHPSRLTIFDSMSGTKVIERGEAFLSRSSLVVLAVAAVSAVVYLAIFADKN